MSAQLIWRDEWLLGIEALDADHRELVRLLNLLLCPDDGGVEPGAPIAASRLQDVMDHLRGHFEREETFLQSIRFPDFEQHKTEHSLQMAEFMDLKRELEQSGVCCVEGEDAEGVKRWLFNHVIAEDQRFARYYYEQLGRETP